MLDVYFAITRLVPICVYYAQMTLSPLSEGLTAKWEDITIPVEKFGTRCQKLVANSRGAARTRSNRRNANVQEPANSFDAPTPYGKHLLVHEVTACFRRIFRSLKG